MYQTGAGPYRIVSDNQLRPIFNLTPPTMKIIMFSYQPPEMPGVNQSVVTTLLRAMLYLHKDAPSQRDELYRDIHDRLSGRDNLAIQAALLSRCRQALEEPWNYPALLDTQTCRQLYHQLGQVTTGSDKVASIGNNPFTNIGVGALLIKYLSKLAGSGLELTTFFAGQSKDHYQFQQDRIANELALRGLSKEAI